MRFGQRKPCRALQHLVKFYWMVEDATAGDAAAEVVIPDGCMEMIFHFGTPFSSDVHGDNYAVHPRAFVGGQITQSIRIRPAGPIGMLGVRFHPFGAQPLLKIAMDEIAGETVDATDLFGASALHTVERLMEADGVEPRFDVVESFLLRLTCGEAAVDPLARSSIEALTMSHGSIPVHRLAAQMHVSPRHLNKMLRRHVGLGAKSFARIVRLQFALASIRGGSASTLTDAACAAGYFDQAHFIRDFRVFCGANPRAYLGERHALAEAFA